MVEPIPLRNAVKIAALTGGSVVGLGLSLTARATLPSPETEERLKQRGISTMSHREATARFAPIPFMLAAAAGTGMARRSGSAAITTASLGAAAMLASSAQGIMADADDEAVGDRIRALGLTSVLAAGAFAVGAMDEVPLNFAKGFGLAMLGLSAGGFMPETVAYVAGLPGEYRRSAQHREG